MGRQMLVRSRMLVTVTPEESTETATQELQSAIGRLRTGEGVNQFLQAEVAEARRAGRFYIIFDIELDSVNEAQRVTKKVAEGLFAAIENDRYTLAAGSHFVIPV